MSDTIANTIPEVSEFEKNLGHFTGTDEWHRHGFGRFRLLLTDGAKYVAEEGKAYWLFDLIFSYQPQLRNFGNEEMDENFQVWELKRLESGSWEASCNDGNRKVLVSQHIPYSDFPLTYIKIYCIDGVCLLPSEN
jgi:hypothetical protein